MSYTCTVKQGNLLNEDNATFIINASNTTLVLGSGVSAAFRKKCGMKLQQEMFDKLKSLDRKLQKGDVIATSSGDASNFKYALHAAVMDYNQGINGKDKLPTIDTINLILNNIEPYLQWYSDNSKDEIIKLVLPLMGCGVGGLNSKEVLDTYKSFFEKESSFDCEVVIYGHSTEDYELARSIFLDTTQYTYPLLFENKHLFMILDDKKWLIDTGSPASFGEEDSLSVCNEIFKIENTYGTLNAKELTSHIGLEVTGLIGVDILNKFDILFSINKYEATLSKNSINLEGDVLPADSFMGIPTIKVNILDTEYTMFFDTGAQISYFQSPLLKDFPSNGTIKDFYPGIGEFKTETYLIDLDIGSSEYKLICGSLPILLSETLMMASVQGIVSNELMKDKIIGYFPKRQQIVIG